MASTPLPVLFIAHGAPPLLDMPEWVAQLNTWARTYEKPKAILMISAHWEAHPVTLGATRTVPLVYDFGGFPAHHYAQKYSAPGAPRLAERVKTLLASVTKDSERGLDHGAYVPLVAMYPSADIPVLQVSLPSEDPRTLHAFGKSLAPLRTEGVLIAGSGFITHNLRGIDWSDGPNVAPWAADFDAWTASRLLARDVDALLDYRNKAPAVRQSLPTHEHFAPLLVALGASETTEAVGFPIEGFWLGSLTKRSVQFG